MNQETNLVEIMIPQAAKPEAEEAVKLFEELDQDGRGKLLEFIRGVKFAINLQGQKPAM